MKESNDFFGGSFGRNMDFDDGDDKPKEVSKPRKFAPGGAGKFKPKAKTEPIVKIAKKAEPSSQADVHLESVSKSEHDVDAKFAAPHPKVEPAVLAGVVKMEVDSRVHKEPETTEAEMMDEDRREQEPPLQEENEEEEEEDVVVREIDVFFNPSIDANTQIYVMQYPLRPEWRPYELDERCEEVRVKPSTCEVQIDLSLDVHCSNYDPEFGSKLNMTKHTLKTMWVEPPCLKYAVGVLSGDELHLNPVHAIAQLRPSMEYLSSTGKKEQAESAEASKKQIKGVQTSTNQKATDEENWVPLKYHGLHSEFCSRHLQNMMAKGNSAIDFNMTPKMYISSLSTAGRSTNTESKSELRRRLSSLPLEHRMQKLLSEEGFSLVRYSVLKYFASEHSNEEILRVLQQHALLVQGLWIVKTRLLKLDGPLAAARDYVLTLFSKDSTIKYSQVDATGRNREKVKSMLTFFAKDRPLLRDWKFKEPADVTFIKCYPEIVKEQEVVWKAMEDKIMPMIQGPKGRADNRRNVVPRPAATVRSETPTVSETGTTTTKSTITTVRRKMSEETRRVLPKALKKVFQTHKVCSYQTICQGLRDLAVCTSNNPKADSNMAVTAALGADAPQEELQEVISEVAFNIHGSYVLKSSLDHPEYDPLRHVVIELLRGLVPGTKLMKADVFAAGLTELGREITNNEYNKVMHDICETSSSGWVLQKAR